MLAASQQTRRGFLSPRKSGGSDKGGNESGEKLSHFCTTSRRVAQFSGGGGKPIPPGARVVYVHGAFDMFHAGHVHLLEAAKELGTMSWWGCTRTKPFGPAGARRTQY